MVRGEASPALLEAVKAEGLDLAGILPDDQELADADLAGKPHQRAPRPKSGEGGGQGHIRPYPEGAVGGIIK